MIVLNMVADFKNNGNDVVILRDQHGKWYCKINGLTTQKKLNASEVIRWLSNLANEE